MLNKSRDKAHILVGIVIAVSNIDEVIKIIRLSADVEEAKQKLMKQAWSVGDIWDLIKKVDDQAILAEQDKKCYLTEQQTKAILEMRLQRLTNIEKSKVQQDLNSLSSEINYYLKILGSREKLLEIMKSELIEIKEQFATPRLTEIDHSEFEKDIEDLIPQEDMVVTVTLEGYIKRVPLSTYRAQKRGGKGRSGLSMRDEDVTTHLFVENTHTSMLFFSNIGQVYSLKVYKLPLGTPQSKGRPIVNILPIIKEGERITNIMPMPEDEADLNNMYIIFATSYGNIRRNALSDFKRIPSNGKIAIRLDEGDSLIAVKSCSKDNHILLATRDGKAVRCPVESVRIFKSRISDGVRGIKLSNKDKVIAMAVLRGNVCSGLEERENYLKLPVSDRLAIARNGLKEVNISGNSLTAEKLLAIAKGEELILTVSENGYGKLSSAYEYRVTGRGTRGVVNMLVSSKTGKVVTVLPAHPDDEVMLITSNGTLIRCPLNNVRVTGRNASGVILFKTASGEKVVSVDIVSERDCGNEKDVDNP